MRELLRHRKWLKEELGMFNLAESKAKQSYDGSFQVSESRLCSFICQERLNYVPRKIVLEFIGCTFTVSNTRCTPFSPDLNILCRKLI